MSRKTQLPAVRVHRALIGAALLLSACGSAAAQQTPPTVVVQIPASAAPTVPAAPTRPATATAAPTSTATPTGTATAAPTAAASPTTTASRTGTSTPLCRERRGSLLEIDVPSPAADCCATMRTRVYLPPCYEERQDLAYPVLYLLHGRGHTQATWDEIGVDEAAENLIAGGAAPPFIVVMPREVGGERFGDAVIADLLPVVAANFRTIPQRRFRALGGMSRGAGWALRIGLQHPRLFGALGLHSLAIFYADEGKVDDWLADVPDGRLPRIYLDIGEVDGLMVSAEHLHELLVALPHPHEFIVQPGGHSEQYWSAHVGEYLRWYALGWEGAPLDRSEVLK